MKSREITFSQAINEALSEEMRRDPTVFIIGEDVAEAGTPFKVLSGLVGEFGTQRVIDSPISEAGISGIGVGAAMTGMRPVVDIMFGDFITLTMDQLVNQAAKIHYMSGGKLKVPMVLRTTLGATRRSAAQHSQSLHAWVSHVPGLKVVVPSTPYDAKGLLKSAIRDDNPVVFFEDKMMYQLKGPVPPRNTRFRWEWLISSAPATISRWWQPAAWCMSRWRQQQYWQMTISAPKLSMSGRPRRWTRQTCSIGQKNQPRHRHRRRLSELRRHGRNCFGDCRRRLLLSRRARQAHGRHECAGAVFAGA